MTSHRTGLLIIRAWIEEGSSQPLRAQLRLTADVTGGIERTVTFTRAEEVGVAVQEWLAGILATADPSPSPRRLTAPVERPRKPGGQARR